MSVNVAKKGFVIALPTDTVYGLAASVYDDLGIEKIYQIKDKPKSEVLATLCSSKEMIEDLAQLNQQAIKLIDSLMPGPLTIIVFSNSKFYEISGERTIGVRIPNNKVTIKIIEKYGPLKTTSANIHNMAPFKSITEIKKAFKEQIDCYYNGQNNSSNIPSTVIDLTKDPYEIIREGEITKENIDRVINK